jgi:hypothetical protein
MTAPAGQVPVSRFDLALRVMEAALRNVPGFTAQDVAVIRQIVEHGPDAMAAVPVSDEAAVWRLLGIRSALADLLGEVTPGRELVIDGVLTAVQAALARLGYITPEGPDGEALWWSGA